MSRRNRPPAPPPTLDAVLAAQQDLSALCADRPLRTAEVFPGNAYYGSDRVLKSYAQIDEQRALKVALPHSIEYTDVPFFPVRELVPVHAYCRRGQDAFYRSLGVRTRFWPMATPYLYALELVREQAKPERRGTLFFPSHSAGPHEVEFDMAAVAARLTALPERYHPVRVCMYWHDVVLGHDRAFRKAGLEIVSAGHIFDPDFLFRFHHLSSLHAYATSNEIGSHCFYAIASGCTYFDLGVDRPVWRNWEQSTSRTREDVREAFRAIEGADRAAQLEQISPYLGAKYLQARDELRRTLHRADVLDKFGFVLRDATGDRSVEVPAVLRRGVRRLARPVLKAFPAAAGLARRAAQDS